MEWKFYDWEEADFIHFTGKIIIQNNAPPPPPPKKKNSKRLLNFISKL